MARGYPDSATLGGGREPVLQVGEGGVKSKIPHLRKVCAPTASLLVHRL